ncbi:MAG: sugar phosphate nucleotidyltransferase [Rhodothermales bacterium]
MILAAGRGTRIQPLTYNIPKPMIPLVRKPVLESIIELLRQHGADQIVINTSHLAPIIEDYFGDGSAWQVEIAYSFEGHIENDKIKAEALGSAGGMKYIQNFSGFFDDTFLVLCGDALIDLDIQAAVAFHCEKGALATIVMKEVPLHEVHKYGVVETDDLGRIRQFQEKPAAHEAVSTTINTGIYIFEPEIFDHIPAGRDFDIGSELFPALVSQNLPFYGVSLPFQWLDIGSITDFWHATRTVLSGEFKGYRLPGNDLGSGLRCGINVRMNRDRVDIEGPVYIGGSCDIGDDSLIKGPVVIGPGSVIQPGAEIRECLIDSYTRVSSVARIEELIVSHGHCIKPDGSFINHDAADLGWLIDDARHRQRWSEEHNLLVQLAQQSNAVSFDDSR